MGHITADFARVATEYAQDVVDGKVIACKWHRLACQRHLKDLERAKDGGWVYEWNPELLDWDGKKYFPAERVCKFAQLLPHIKGDWAARSERIVLQRWQIFILASIFGWIVRDTGKRRFRFADLFVPRKNAKSTIAAIIGLYMLAPDGEFGAEVYSGASNESQAHEVFRPARLMTIATDRLRSKYGITVNKSNLVIVAKNSKFETVIGRPGDGASPSCAIVDEYHEHKTTEQYETMKTGMGARSQPLMLVITTAGSDIGGPCYLHQDELQKILEGTVENERRFGIIFTIDEKEDWATEEALRKANPNFGVSVNAETLLADLAEAKGDPQKQSTFKTKHLNIWEGAESPWLNILHFQTKSKVVRLEDFKGAKCFAGTDLASVEDIASNVKLFSDSVAGDVHYYAFSRNYVPEEALKKKENQRYVGWVKQGYLIKTDGNMIDLDLIKEDILADREIFTIVEVAMDDWGSREIAPALQAKGLTVSVIPMVVKHLSPPMKKIAALVNAGRFHHDHNPAFIWMASNVNVKPDRNENIFPRKLRNENKIDSSVATIIAMSRAMQAEPQPDVAHWLANAVVAG